MDGFVSVTDREGGLLVSGAGLGVETVGKLREELRGLLLANGRQGTQVGGLDLI
jgi:hypothetical protein